MTTAVSFELANLLKEKGFDKSTEANWWVFYEDHNDNYKKSLPVDKTKIFFTKNNNDLDSIIRIDEKHYKQVYHVLSAPTVAEVVMWLYEKYNIWITVLQMLNNGEKVTWYASYYEKGVGEDIDVYYNSPTEAYEAAIEYTLKNLI